MLPEGTPVVVSAFSLVDRLCILEDGKRLTIVAMIDRDGEETGDWRECVQFIAGENGYGWITLTVADCIPVVLN